MALRPRQDGRTMARVVAPLDLALRRFAVRRLRARLFVAADTAVAVGGAAERAVDEGTTVIAASHDHDLIAAGGTTLTLPIGAEAAAG